MSASGRPRRSGRRAPAPSRRSRAGRARSPRSRLRRAARRCAPRSASSRASRGAAAAAAALARAVVGEPAMAPAHLRRRRPTGSCTAPLTSGRMADRYDPKAIEPKWQRVWADEHTWEVSNEPDERPKALRARDAPLPLGRAAHRPPEDYSVGDAIAHFRRRTRHRVLHPMGYDAFGLPAENHAIKTGQHPRESTEASIARVPAPVPRAGAISIDWTREFGTHEPRVYRWTQWIFLRLLERGLAYRKEAAVKWCPNDADRARQRAGDRRPLRALRHAGRGRASSSSGSSASPTTPTACSRTCRRSTGRGTW